MQIKDVFPYRKQFSGLTPAQYEAGVAWCNDSWITYEDYAGDNRTDVLRTVQATDEQNAALQAILEAAS